MKDWAIEQGRHPLTPTGSSPDRHHRRKSTTAFVSPATSDGTAIMEFSGKELIKGEPDASSFPSGGLRATFEARGYTAWDPTSYAFVKDDVLCIPTAFLLLHRRGTGQKDPAAALHDAHLPTQACRILKLFGKDVERRHHRRPRAGVLPDRQGAYLKRLGPDLTGRTLFGATPQGPGAGRPLLRRHPPRVSAFMKELDEELWKLGIPAKTKHNEVAPASMSWRPSTTTTNIAIDHNQLTMEMMKRSPTSTAWSACCTKSPLRASTAPASTTTGRSPPTRREPAGPGDTPRKPAVPAVPAAVIKAVDEYQDCCAPPSPPRQRPPSGRQRSASRPSSPSSSATSWKLFSMPSNDSPYAGPARRKMDLGVDVLPSSPRTPPTATVPLRSPSPATSSSSVCPAPLRTSPTPTSC